MASCKAVTAGIRWCFTLTAAAIYIADGNESFDDCAIFHVIVGVHRPVCFEWHARELAAAIGDHLVTFMLNLRALPVIQHMQREHVVMLGPARISSQV